MSDNAGAEEVPKWQCLQCGNEFQEENPEKCPFCKGKDITKIN